MSAFRGRLPIAACMVGSLVLASLAAGAYDWPKTQAEALAFERADRMPPTSFYDTPTPLPSGEPGKLIRSQVVAGYTLPRGVRAVRILYHSRSAIGGDVPASGVVLLPPGSPPRRGWPVIAWAHGTSGVARICGPSEMKDIYYGVELLPFLRAGFALVATDYAGLGTRVPHQYESLNAQANDVIDAVTAAHEAVGDLSPRWVVDGHSQGGGAAWFVAQQEARIEDPGFLGAVSVSGAADMASLMDQMGRNGSDVYYSVLWAYGIKARFPAFNPADMLNDRALAQYHALTTRGCWYYGHATQESGLLGKTALRPGWAANPWVKRFIAQNPTFQRRPTRPLLLISGGAEHDESFLMMARHACRLGYVLDLRVFPGFDHTAAMARTQSYQLRWIRDRFAGRAAPDSCTSASGH